jgi:hypothetical protein
MNSSDGMYGDSIFFSSFTSMIMTFFIYELNIDSLQHQHHLNINGDNNINTDFGNEQEIMLIDDNFLQGILS